MTAPRYFTVEQANATLPLVRRIVADIMDEYHRWKEILFRYEMIAASSQAAQGETPEQVALQRQVDESARRIDGFMSELSKIGCVFKGFEQGLVDFYHRRDERDVLLCWQVGEERVVHWHEVDAGFSGRQTIT
jgi:hypothetical protein